MTITNISFYESISLGVLTSALIIAIAPYLFRLFLPTHTEAILPATIKELIFRYIYGTATILIGGSITVSLLGFWWIALIYLIIAGGCGLVVILRYFTSDIARNKQQNQIQRDHNPDLK